MKVKGSEDVVTLAKLRSQPLAVVKQARKSRGPVVVTSNGKPDVVVMDATTFERRLKVANLATLIAVAEADVAAGRTRPAQEFFAEFRRGKKVPG
jgi:prevent-host-death family protein